MGQGGGKMRDARCKMSGPGHSALDTRAGCFHIPAR
jgi:hypothetical protein